MRGVAPLEEVLRNLDARLAREHGRIDVLMLSGGEPTLYPELPRLLKEVSDRNVVRILINTNGVRIARDDTLLELLAEHRERVEVYLQYDGASAEASVHHRGADLRRLKDAAIDRLSGRGIFTTLTMTAALGVNDGEIGAVVQRCLRTPYVGGVSIQPQFGSGRSAAIDPLNRLTHGGVLARLGPHRPTAASPGGPDRAALLAPALLLRRVPAARRRRGLEVSDHADRPRQAPPAPGVGPRVRRQPDRRHRATSRAPHRGQGIPARSAVRAVFAVAPRVGDLWRDICENCDLGVATLATLAASSLPGQRKRLRKLLGERVKRITVKPFMDASTMIEERLIQCCVHVGTRSADGADQCAPFCAVQAWPALSAQRLSSSTSRTLPLLDPQ
ncbi:radical SAM protein [Longispora sp. K20-0274]|uniref:radical SAM protein n=1 Tax=Longispora sp. K20-0274 TaxID=3088255 RepID=UPI003999B79D